MAATAVATEAATAAPGKSTHPRPAKASYPSSAKASCPSSANGERAAPETGTSKGGPETSSHCRRPGRAVPETGAALESETPVSVETVEPAVEPVKIVESPPEAEPEKEG